MERVKTISATFNGKTVTYTNSTAVYAKNNTQCQMVNDVNCKPTRNAPGKVKAHTKEAMIKFFTEINS